MFAPRRRCFASASVSPRERRTHIVFAVWCLGSPRACVVHVLTHVFSSARFTCCAWSGVTQHHSLPSPPRAARVEGVVSRLVVNSAMPCLWPLLCVAGNTSSLEPQPRRSAHCAFRRALLCSVSRDRPRWSFFHSRPCAGGHPMSPLCTSLLSLSTCVWRDRGSLPWFGFPRFGLRGALPPKLSRCDSSQLSPVRLAVCLVVSGHFSTQTCSN